MTMTRKTYGDIIRHLREQQGIGQAQLAAMADVDAAELCAIEANSLGVTRDDLGRLFTALGYEL